MATSRRRNPPYPQDAAVLDTPQQISPRCWQRPLHCHVSPQPQVKLWAGSLQSFTCQQLSRHSHAPLQENPLPSKTASCPRLWDQAMPCGAARLPGLLTGAPAMLNFNPIC